MAYTSVDNNNTIDEYFNKIKKKKKKKSTHIWAFHSNEWTVGNLTFSFKQALQGQPRQTYYDERTTERITNERPPHVVKLH